MGRIERDFQGLLIETMHNIREIYSKKNTIDSLEDKNQLIQTVNYLEDILTPYFNQSDKTRYDPGILETDNEDIIIHKKLRTLMRVAQGAGVINPLRVTESDDEISFDDLQ